VITSSTKDAAIFVRDNPSLFASKTREVVVMGGCKPIPPPDKHISTGYGKDSYWSTLAKKECEPDSANNNTFDTAAAEFFYSQCQKNEHHIHSCNSFRRLCGKDATFCV